ncbi:hypothetical protein SASPL_136098 [Salvia splendens]|uniref:Uncharacterized protein n=1 Tax=Salvia splendens TaxID=180675 RepID=A0A8X8X074_SALSN|nr:uncharacterized protein LOC121760790 [Salvia splendens]KAG6403864.1 hypothetical protein SASPL_136098 [Salvia splendens]
MTDVAVSLPQQPRDHPILRRRSSIPSSIVVAPPKLNLLHHHSSSTTTSATTSSSSDYLELLSIKPNPRSYTSLKDLLPTTAVNSPRPSSAQAGSDICIRNRLVKQAAWAYLQPMSTASGSVDGGFLRRMFPRLAALFDLVRRSVARAINWTLQFVWIRCSR